MDKRIAEQISIINDKRLDSGDSMACLARWMAEHFEIKERDGLRPDRFINISVYDNPKGFDIQTNNEGFNLGYDIIGILELTKQDLMNGIRNIKKDE